MRDWAKMVVFALAFNCLAATAATTAFAAEPGPIRIVALGDSLTAGFNLPQREAFPAQLERALRARGHNVEVLNAGVSGDTIAGGLARLDWAVPENAEAVIVELGANDALRALDPGQARANLEKIVKRLTGRGLEVLLAGMAAPRNLGQEYTRAYDLIFPDLAKKYDLVYYPFFLKGVAFEPELSLSDGLHPNGKGVARIVEGILPRAEELIERVKAKRLAAHRG
jgi:acyl-CoA thioesterase-1